MYAGRMTEQVMVGQFEVFSFQFSANSSQLRAFS